MHYLPESEDPVMNNIGDIPAFAELTLEWKGQSTNT